MGDQWSENSSQWIAWPPEPISGLPPEGDVRVGRVYGDGKLEGKFVGEAHYSRAELPDGGAMEIVSTREGVTASVGSGGISADTGGEGLEINTSDESTIEVEIG